MTKSQLSRVLGFLGGRSPAPRRAPLPSSRPHVEALESRELPTSATVSPIDQQLVKGWGIFPAYARSTTWGPNNDIIHRYGVQQALFKDLGATVLRVELPASAYNPNSPDLLDRVQLDEMADQLKAARRLNPTMRYFVTIWSPPAAFKDPPTVSGITWHLPGYPDGMVTHLVGYGTGDANSAPTAQEAAFVRWESTALNYLNATGAGLPVGVSLQNEPTWAVPYDGAVYDNNQYIRVLKEMRKVFDAQGLGGVQLAGPEANTYTDTKAIVLDDWARRNDPALNNAFGMIATHSYDAWADPATRYNLFTDYTNALNAYPTKDVVQSEWHPDASEAPANASPMDLALTTGRHLAREMVGFRTNYWFYWMGWYYQDTPGTNLTYGKVPDNSTVAPQKTKTYTLLSKLWSLVPGDGTWRVRSLTTDDPDLKASTTHTLVTDGLGRPINGTTAGDVDLSAYTNGASTVVMLSNPTNVTKTLDVRNLIGNKAELWVLNDANDMTFAGAYNVVNGTLPGLVLPARSIVLLRSSGNVLTNPGFETDGRGTQAPAGWLEWSPTGDTSAAFTENIGTSRSGQYQLAHYKPTPYNVSTYQIRNVPNGTYTVTAWVQSGGGQDQAYLYAYRYANPAGGPMRTVNIPATGSGNWQLIVLDNVQVTSGQIEIGVHSQSSTGGQWLRVDDVVLAPNVAANFSFEADGKGTGTPAGWSEWSPNGAGDLNASFTEAMGTAHGGTFQLAQWRNTPYAVGTYQIVNVPNGLYTLTAWVESSGGQDQAYMYAYRYDTAAGGQIRTVNIPATGSGPGDWKMLVLNNVQVTSGQIEIGFFSKTSQGNQWIRVDDVSLIDPPEDGGAVPGGGPAPRPLTNERSAGTAAPLPIPEEVAGGPREAKADRPYQPTAAYHDIDLTEAAPLLAAPPRNEGVAEPTRKRTKPPVKKDPWADLNQAEGWELPFDKAA